MKKTLGGRIASLRKEKGMTQLELAEKLGVTDKAVSKWERDLCCPDIAALPKLAEVLGIRVDALMQADTEPKEETKKELAPHASHDHEGGSSCYGCFRCGAVCPWGAGWNLWNGNAGNRPCLPGGGFPWGETILRQHPIMASAQVSRSFSHGNPSGNPLFFKPDPETKPPLPLTGRMQYSPAYRVFPKYDSDPADVNNESPVPCKKESDLLPYGFSISLIRTCRLAETACLFSNSISVCRGCTAVQNGSRAPGKPFDG